MQSVLSCAAVSMQVFKAYCEKKSIEQQAVRFVFDGQRVNGDSTPESVSRGRLLPAVLA
jgi:hypothetical protein